MYESQQDFLLCYTPRDASSPWWTRHLDSELAHVDIWQPVGDGCYVVTAPLFDMLAVNLVGHGPKTGVVQRVSARRCFGVSYFPLGPRTCVTVAKFMLGIRDWRVQTPRQLHRYIEERHGQVD